MQMEGLGRDEGRGAQGDQGYHRGTKMGDAGGRGTMPRDHGAPERRRRQHEVGRRGRALGTTGDRGYQRVGGADGCRQAVRRVVCDAQRLFLRPEGGHTQDGPEHLLPPNSHVRRYICKHRRLHIEPTWQVRGPAPSRQHPRTPALRLLRGNKALTLGLETSILQRRAGGKESNFLSLYMNGEPLETRKLLYGPR